MTKHFTPTSVLMGLLIVVFGCGQTKKQVLFNEKDLEGWDAYIAPAADSIPPPGLNNDPSKVFSVASVDGAPVIRVSGEYYGGLSTKEEFENYHLTLQFKWGEAKIPSFQNRKRDSGVLYHATGPHGVDARAWMRSQEFQVQEGDCGDYWGVAGAIFDIPAAKNDKDQYVYNADSPRLTFRDKTDVGRRCIKDPDAEKPTGEWNTIDLYCSGDSSVHMINGVVVMRLYRSRQTDNGTDRSLAKGKIQLQSEGCEIYYRALVVESIDGIPKNLGTR